LIYPNPLSLKKSFPLSFIGSRYGQVGDGPEEEELKRQVTSATCGHMREVTQKKTEKSLGDTNVKCAIFQSFKG
jgi:hypothetical protein